MINQTRSSASSVKKMIKRGIQITAARFGRHMQRTKEPELLLLMYHRILPANDPRGQLEEPGMMVTPETFKMHMNIIKTMFETIHLSDWLEKKNKGEMLPAKSCAITFDDGWADNYEFAFPVLQQLNIPATIFLVADMVGKKQRFWPERLAKILTAIANNHATQWSHASLDWLKHCAGSYTFSHLPPTSEQISEIIAGVKLLSDDDIHQRLDTIEKQLDIKLSIDQPSLLSWQQIKTMTGSGLIEAGSHTCHHIRLTEEKPANILQDEIIKSKQLIENKTGTNVSTFCFPNGDYSDAALSLVKQHYSGSVTTQHGWNTVSSDNFLLHRTGVHEDISNDRTSFLSCISGWL